MTKTAYRRLTVERLDTEKYRLEGFLHDRGSGETKEIIASYLNVNGIAFACNQATFAEHGEKVVVEQEVEGGSANIKVQSST